MSEAFIALMTAVGGDVTYGRRLYRLFQAAGLVDIACDGYLTVAGGGSAGSLANVRQMRPRLLESSGLTDAGVTGFEAALEDPRFSWLMPVLLTARGALPVGLTAVQRQRTARSIAPERIQ